MKKIILAGVNSKYNHVSLSIRALYFYVKKYSAEFGESFTLSAEQFTINQNLLDVLKKIVLEKPDCVLFSVYIWNVEFIQKIIREIKKLLPECCIGLGGPEVSYSAVEFLRENPSADFIMCGEGEITLKEFCEQFSKENFAFEKIKGICYRTGSENLPAEKIKFTEHRELIENLDELPFVYCDENNRLCSDVDSQNSIIYYESSRGCPFSCSYCLSSVDKSVRFKSLELVKNELKFFLENKVRLVKFVDRTFNLKEERYIEIWKYIIENWNGVTTFHFEIEAQQLTQKALETLKDVKPNCMQFEIGIQTTNLETLEAINRKCNLEKIRKLLDGIPQTIHVHLDLIAGLPYESLSEFSTSFNSVISLKPKMLQLGFLKILHGTQMESFAKQFSGYRWLSCAPYEVLQSPWMSFEDLQFLKHADELVDKIYNSQNFLQTVSYLFKSGINFWNLFEELINWFEGKKLFQDQHKPDAYFSFLYDYFDEKENELKTESKTETINENINKKASLNSKIHFTSENILILKQLLRFDFIRRNKTSTFPLWYERFYDKEKHRNALEKHYDIQSTRDAYINSSYEEFSINPLNFEICRKGRKAVLFVFNSEKLKGAASRTFLKAENTECILLDEKDCL